MMEELLVLLHLLDRLFEWTAGGSAESCGTDGLCPPQLRPPDRCSSGQHLLGWHRGERSRVQLSLEELRLPADGV